MALYNITRYEGEIVKLDLKEVNEGNIYSDPGAENFPRSRTNMSWLPVGGLK